jgi:ribonuclease BN (tRNA processing enzyme)
MKITMLGVGNGFSPGIYDNNALIQDDEDLCMIDCGITAWISLTELNRAREDISSIFVTHLHFDHSGGVESAALYGKYISGRKTRLIVPEPIVDILWDHVLKGTIENKQAGLVGLEDYFIVDTPKNGELFRLCGSLCACWFPTKHIAGKFSCGLVIDGRILYTSDMLNDLPLLEKMVKQGIKIIFHDCQLRDAKVHADFQTMKAYPESIRNKIFLMHHGLKGEDVPDSAGMRFLFQHREMSL